MKKYGIFLLVNHQYDVRQHTCTQYLIKYISLLGVEVCDDLCDPENKFDSICKNGGICRLVDIDRKEYGTKCE